ncbi:MAG: hypothetical protein JRN15_12030, partial [Nitrososphaerota archaeon]|nr:hypothetical protein [Nitrososphaerota archaeon]
MGVIAQTKFHPSSQLNHVSPSQFIVPFGPMITFGIRPFFRICLEGKGFKERKWNASERRWSSPSTARNKRANSSYK